jgi:NADH-quinone oxidoreductase subunit C
VTVALKGQDLAQKLGEKFAGSVTSSDNTTVILNPESLLKVAEYLRDSEEYQFDYLANLTAADYMDYFEVVYNLVSLGKNHSLVLKARVYGREHPSLPSVYHLWRTAEYQEREIYDLLGIKFEGHPFMKRLFLWEGFPGHPLRRDYL